MQAHLLRAGWHSFPASPPLAAVAVLGACGASRWYPTVGCVSHCWMRGWRAENWRETWAPGRGQKSERKSSSVVENGHTPDRGHFSHRGQQLCLRRVVTLCRWPPGQDRTGQDGTDSLQAAAVCVQRLAVKAPPLENKASGSSDWEKERADWDRDSSAELLSDTTQARQGFTPTWGECAYT